MMASDAADETAGGRTALWISGDEGLTWADTGDTIAGIHAGAVQLEDGRLMALGRGDNDDGQGRHLVGGAWTDRFLMSYKSAVAEDSASRETP